MRTLFKLTKMEYKFILIPLSTTQNYIMQLRDYQQNMVQQTAELWNAGSPNVLGQLSTGGGKSVILSTIVRQHDGYSVVIAHRTELVSQLSLTLAGFGIRHNIIAPKDTIREIVATHHVAHQRSFYDPNAVCFLASVDTLLRLPAMTSWFNRVTLLIIDEAHHVLYNNKWGRACVLFPNARGFFPTATPVRADGRGLGRYSDGLMDKMIIGPSMRQLITEGYLSDYRIFAPPSDLDLSGVGHSASGEFSPIPLRTAVHKSRITGDIVEHYLKIAAGKRGVTFAVDIKAATEIALAFRLAGISAEVISSLTPPLLRQNAMRRFRSGELLQIVNVDIMGEGVDVPAIEVVSMGRPTESYATFAQQFGRSLRPLPGKTCIARGTKILTHVGEVSIENITLDHLLWDGISYVKHSGVACMGSKKTVAYGGLTATLDHKVMTKKGWVSFEKAITRRIRIIKTGVGGVSIRYFGDSIPIRGGGVRQIKSFGEMQKMQPSFYAPISQYEEKNQYKSVSKLQCPTTGNSTVLGLHEMPTATLQVHQHLPRGIPKLRRQRYRISFYYRKRSLPLGTREPGNTPRPEEAIRPNRQRRALRTGQSPVGYRGFKLQQYENYPRGQSEKVLRIPRKIRLGKVCRFNFTKINISRTHGFRNHRKMEFPLMQTEREVWDVLNAGPLQRYTANGYLVHNCAIIIDHVNNYARHGLPDAPRVWTLDPREKRSRSTPEDVIPLKTCVKCLSVYTRFSRDCPYCGHYLEPQSRGAPQFVDGDLFELDAETLAALRGEAERNVSDQPKYPRNVEPYVIKGIQNRHAEKIRLQHELRAAIAQWAGYYKHNGASDSEIYRRFYHAFNIDILSAQALGTSDTNLLYSKIVDSMDNN